MYFDHGVVVVSTPKMSCQIPTMKVQYPLEVSPTKYLPSPAAFSRMGAASFSWGVVKAPHLSNEKKRVV